VQFLVDQEHGGVVRFRDGDPLELRPDSDHPAAGGRSREQG
jgi:hypothetical protein